jgi:hypothetical protein
MAWEPKNTRIRLPASTKTAYLAGQTSARLKALFPVPKILYDTSPDKFVNPTIEQGPYESN